MASLDDVVSAIKGLENSIKDSRRTSTASSEYGGRGFSRNYSDVDLEERIRRIERDRDFQAKETKSASRMFGSVFGDIGKSFRDIQYNKEKFNDAVDDFGKSMEDLKKSLKDTTLSNEEALKEAKKQLKEYANLIESSKNVIKQSLTGFSDDIKDEIVKKIGEIDFSDTTKALGELDKIANESGVSGVVFTLADVDKFKDEFSKIKKYEKERNDLGEEYTNSLHRQTDLLEKQERVAVSIKNTMKEGIRNIEDGFGKIKKTTLDFVDGWRKVDAASSKFVRNIGMGVSAMVALRRNTINAIGMGGLGMKYNISMEELLNIQQDYSKAIGRNVGITGNDQENMAAISAVMGAKGTELAVALENFGLSYTDTAKLAGKMFLDASKYGLNFEKYSENFLRNIKLAQNYTFKDGINGLERMAKTATAIRLDMSQIASFADKVNSLEGAVQTSAALQVLGGSFAQFSDPLGMLYESLSDMEGLTNRFQNIVGKLGRFNEKTGQVEVTAFDKQRLRAAAPAMGMSYEQVMESIQAQGRRNYIQGKLNTARGRFSDEEREFLLNTATVQNGVPQLSFLTQEGKRITKNVNELTSADIKQAKIQNQSDSDNIKEIAKSTRSLNDKLEGVKKGTEAIKAGVAESGMNWLSNSLNNIANYTSVIKGAVLTIAGLQIGAGTLKMFGGAGQLIGGSTNFLRGFNVAAQGHRLPTGAHGAVAAGGNFFNGIKSFGATGGGGFGLGLAGVASAILAVGMTVQGIFSLVKAKKLKDERDDLVARGLIKKGDKEDTRRTIEQQKKIGGGFGALGGVVAGAAIGTILGGPGVGTAIGAGIGGVAGYFAGEWGTKGKKAIEKRKKEAIEEERLRRLLLSRGYSFGGGYSEQEFRQIIEAIRRGDNNTISKNDYNTLSDELKQKLIQSGDISLFPELQEFAVQETSINSQNTTISAQNVVLEGKVQGVKKGANGGLLYGASHANGGMPILGSNIEVEGGEYVVNKHSAQKNLGLLESINRMDNGGIIPVADKYINPIAVLPGFTGINGNGFNGNSNNSMDINMNINGTIKLDGGNGKNIDMNELLKDPVFIRQMTDLIQKEIVYKTKGARYTTNL